MFNNLNRKGHGFCPVPPVHWTRCDHDMCPKLDRYHNRNESSVTGHWTEATPNKNLASVDVRIN